ncbi:hypothetical protein HHI36_020507 [Cryptolaemus montrouzieri]|uniref:GPI ethanolamine phosphate transferase 1 n=1 Tax=Cryptolaemus montrouzieri TaxID=559131 RepID=A0ABD2NAY5_9CUCU
MWKLQYLNSQYLKYKLVVLRICVHFLLLSALFEAYFRSPIEKGIEPVKSLENPPSKRVVLFIIDGLRADTIFGVNGNRTPFLTSIRNTRATWGISVATFPTESRTGHAAIISGIHEDASAVFNSFYSFSEKFDSVLNRSRNIWLIASAHMIDIFKFLSGKNKRINSYSFSWDEDQTMIKGDKWVFDTLKKVLEEKKNYSALYEGQSVFLMSLATIDLIGHNFGPNSKEIIIPLKFIDENIEILESMFQKVFGDESTTFILTSDHGMTKNKSHGAGTNDEIYTPIICWGAGIAFNQYPKDIQQIDIAPLISSLLGLEFPVNSLGKIPYNYLNMSKFDKKQLVLNNILQIYRTLQLKQENMIKSTFFCKSYFPKQKISSIWNKSCIDEDFQHYENLYAQIFEAMKSCDYCMKVNILTPVCIGYSLWIFYMITDLLQTEINSDIHCSKFLEILICFYNF